MSEACCSVPSAVRSDRELPAQEFRARNVKNACSICGEKGKPVQGQTVKALLSVSLRAVQNVEYLFCATPTCPVVYFTQDGAQTFTIEQVRERVYQKEQDADDVFVCYCFRNTVGDIGMASPLERAEILDDINAGIRADQCACDLRNPQGACCLGNVRAAIKRLEMPIVAMAP
ncbi:MAG: copper chaperone Copz family protein [Chloroflexi bacterium]|nr:copper chaperone Copz family protein [Chloroflexota bacterium]